MAFENTVDVDTPVQVVEKEVTIPWFSDDFSKLSEKDQAKKLDETDKIITKVETNLIDNENSNLDIIKNLSVDLKDILPLNKLYEGTNFRVLKEFSFNNSVMLRFTNKVLVYLFGKNADTIQSQNPLYFPYWMDFPNLGPVLRLSLGKSFQ